MSESAVDVKGHCYCGAITFRVQIPEGEAPIFTAYCHCDSCRRAHSAALYHVAVVDAPMFEITAGQEHLRDFQKPGKHIVRAFCGICGSKIQNRFPGWTPKGKVPIAFFPSLLEESSQHPYPAALKPQRQNRPEESVLDREVLRELLEHP